MRRRWADWLFEDVVRERVIERACQEGRGACRSSSCDVGITELSESLQAAEGETRRARKGTGHEGEVVRRWPKIIHRRRNGRIMAGPRTDCLTEARTVSRSTWLLCVVIPVALSFDNLEGHAASTETRGPVFPSANRPRDSPMVLCHPKAADYSGACRHPTHLVAHSSSFLTCSGQHDRCLGRAIHPLTFRFFRRL